MRNISENVRKKNVLKIGSVLDRDRLRIREVENNILGETAGELKESKR